MPFRELPNPTRASSRGRAAENGTINAMVLNGGTVRLAIAADVLEAIGNPVAVRIMLGEGEHVGHIAMLPAPSAKNGAYTVKKRKASKQGAVFVGARRIDVLPTKRSTVSLPLKVSATGIIADVRPLAAPTIALVA